MQDHVVFHASIKSNGNSCVSWTTENSRINLKLIIADDHDLVRDAVATLIERDDPSATIWQASDFYDALELAGAHEDVDLALLDVYMPGMNNMKGVQEMAERFPNLPVVLMSGYIQQGDVSRGFGMGARGFVPKTMNGKALVSVLRLVMSGERYVPEIVLEKESGPEREVGLDISPREMDVLVQLTKGLSNKVIARNLDIEETTVKLHLRSLFKKLNVNNRTEAVIVAMDRGIFTESEVL